jgi:hypothetical protein
LTDDRKIDGSTMKAALLRDIPFVKSYAGKPELNAFGEPVTFDGLPVVRRFVTGVEKNHVADYLGRNDLYIPGMPPTIEVGSYLPKEMKDRLQRRALEVICDGEWHVHQGAELRVQEARGGTDQACGRAHHVGEPTDHQRRAAQEGAKRPQQADRDCTETCHARSCANQMSTENTPAVNDAILLVPDEEGRVKKAFVKPYQREGKWFYIRPNPDREFEIRDPQLIADLQAL